MFRKSAAEIWRAAVLLRVASSIAVPLSAAPRNSDRKVRLGIGIRGSPSNSEPRERDTHQRTVTDITTGSMMPILQHARRLNLIEGAHSLAPSTTRNRAQSK